MKPKPFDLVLLILTALFLISLKVFQPSVGPHGGKVKKAGSHYIEFLNPSGNIYAYLLDKNQKPVSNEHISCEAELTFADNTVTCVKMFPFEKEGFSADLIYMDYCSCKVIFYGWDREISAEFEAESRLVKDNE